MTDQEDTRSPIPPPPPPRPDLAKMREAVNLFLQAAGHDPAQEPHLTNTAAQVAQAWAADFLDGYGKDPARILRDSIEFPLGRAFGVDGRKCDFFHLPVAIRDIAIVGVCPHHLLPWGGLAHIAYLPHGKVLGFDAIVQAVNALSHRLTLQEELAWDIATALHHALGDADVLVRLEARQPCLMHRGEKQDRAVTISTAFVCPMALGSPVRDTAEARLLSALTR